jgi:hypothetical protein
MTAHPDDNEANLRWALDRIGELEGEVLEARTKLKRKTPPRVEGQLMTPAEAAAYLRVSTKTFRALGIRSIKPGPGRVKPHRRYERPDLDEFKEKQRHQEAKPCTFSKTPARLTTPPSFGSAVIDIAARLKSGASAKPKR